jgi:hypothetical protein
MKCARCRDTDWVCEAHDDSPMGWRARVRMWRRGHAGHAVPSCNPFDKDHPPRLPAGFRRDESDDPRQR